MRGDLRLLLLHLQPLALNIRGFLRQIKEGVREALNSESHL